VIRPHITHAVSTKTNQTQKRTGAPRPCPSR
jgi:hypothetical protein